MAAPESGDQALLKLTQGPISLLPATVVSAADAAQVAGSTFEWYWNGAWIHVQVAITTAGTSRDARVAIEGSADGSTWHQLARITDVTGATPVNRIIRLGGAAAGTIDAALASADTTSANAGAAVTVNGPLPRYLRAVYQLQATNGCTITIAVKAIGTL